jgi:protein-tyrosine phosphatase
MIAEPYWIELKSRGRLAILPRPRGGDWLEDDVSAWRDAGFDVAVSLLMPDEVEELDLRRESEVCEAEGIQPIEFPIQDRGVPAASNAALALTAKLEDLLNKGKTVGVHCRQGVGRSALIVACILVALGEEPSTAFTRIAKARGSPVPDTPEQEQWVTKFASKLSLPSTA